MKPYFTIGFLTLAVLTSSFSQIQPEQLDKAIVTMAAKLGDLINENGKKKVAVLDFTDLQGRSSELGKYIAEQITVDLVIGKKSFAVLDRANLNRILAEHKLTATGLVDPENAKKLGQFAGVDAFILGTIIPQGQKVGFTAKIITTDTAEIAGATRGNFLTDDSILQMLSNSVYSNSGNAFDGGRNESVTRKKFGDLRLELGQISIIEGKKYSMTITFINDNPQKSIWVAYRRHGNGRLLASLVNPNKIQYESYSQEHVSGIKASEYRNGMYEEATEIKPGESMTSTVGFISRSSRGPLIAGPCQLQMEILQGYKFEETNRQAKLINLVTKIHAIE